MHVAIFGGTGETGLLVIEKTLASGHTVTAYARNPSKITIKNSKLNIIQGELDDTDMVELVVKNAHVVISILGPKGKVRGQAISIGVKNIINSMEKNGVKRLIAIATPSFKDPHDKSEFSFNAAVFMIKSLMKDTYQEIVRLGELVTQSNLDWTLVRLPMLSNAPKKKHLNIGYTGDGKVKLFSLTREDLANFLVEQIKDTRYIHKAPVISN